MSKPLYKRALVMDGEAERGKATCLNCGFTAEVEGKGAHSKSIEAAKNHAETVGHSVRADYARTVVYGPRTHPGS